MSIQTKLLDVIENRRFRRLGGTTTIQVDVQILTATNRNLEDLIRKGFFRQDLYYRLNVVHLELPPLRKRREDIPLLIDHFLILLNRQFRKQFTGCQPMVLKHMIQYEWPGNVRELQNILERVVLMESGPLIEVDHLPCEILNFVEGDPLGFDECCGEDNAPDSPDTCFSLERAERRLILSALKKADGNQSRAAILLGITRDTLRYRLQKYEIRAAGPLSSENTD